MWQLITELLCLFPSLEHYLCLFSTRHCIYPFILHLALCSQQQSMKSPFVRPFGDIVPRGGQGHHSSLVINAGLSALVDFGCGGLSSWACASSYHPGGPARAQTNNFSDESRRPLNHTCSQMRWSPCSERLAVLRSANKLGHWVKDEIKALSFTGYELEEMKCCIFGTSWSWKSIILQEVVIYLFICTLFHSGTLEQALRVSNEKTFMNRNHFLVPFHLQEGTEHTSWSESRTPAWHSPTNLTIQNWEFARCLCVGAVPAHVDTIG